MLMTFILIILYKGSSVDGVILLESYVDVISQSYTKNHLKVIHDVIKYAEFKLMKNLSSADVTLGVH